MSTTNANSDLVAQVTALYGNFMNLDPSKPICLTPEQAQTQANLPPIAVRRQRCSSDVGQTTDGSK